MKPSLADSVCCLGFAAVLLVAVGVSPADAQSKSDRDSPAGEQVVATKSSKIYHARRCSYAKRISEANLVRFRSVAEAEASGRRLCKFCQRLADKDSKQPPPADPTEPATEDRAKEDGSRVSGESGSPPPTPTLVRVKDVLEGGTLVLDTGDKLRLLGVLCPEEGQSHAKEVCRFIREQTRGRKVRLAYDTSTGTVLRRDSLGRIVGHVFLQPGERDLGIELLHQGFGWIDHEIRFDRRTAYDKEERDAAWENRGVWKQMEGRAGKRRVVIGKDAAHYHDPDCNHVLHLTDPKTVSVNLAKSKRRSPCRLFRSEPTAKRNE